MTLGRPLAVYLHVATIGDHRAIVAELAGAIHASGLYDAATSLTCYVVGDAPTWPLWQRWRVERAGPVDGYEYPTLRALWQWAASNKDAAVLYVHTKGASKGIRGDAEHPTDAWRRYMVDCVIRRWRECIGLLDRFATVATELRRPPRHVPHYAGNFWWANADWIAARPEPEPMYVWHHVRYGAETWLLDGVTNFDDHYSFFSLDSDNRLLIAKRCIREESYDERNH